jgi:class 3 adenylate cyclase
MAVMIGVDPHKRSHTAVAINGDEVEVGRVQVRASRVQVDELLAWASQFALASAVLRLLAKRNKQLGSARTAAACRLHTLLAELVPGGIAKEISPNRAAQLRDLHRRIAEAVAASGTSVTELFGFGPVGAAIAVGYTRDVGRFSRGRFAAYNGKSSAAKGIAVRAGMHTGECERRGNDLAGLTVHIAARVAALAASGEVLVSRTVRELVAGSDLRFAANRGEHQLKGIPESWQLFALEA